MSMLAEVGTFDHNVLLVKLVIDIRFGPYTTRTCYSFASIPSRDPIFLTAFILSNGERRRSKRGQKAPRRFYSSLYGLSIVVQRRHHRRRPDVNDVVDSSPHSDVGRLGAKSS